MGRVVRARAAAVLVLIGCVPELRIVHRDAAAEAADTAAEDVARDATGDDAATDAPSDTADAVDAVDAAADVGTDATDVGTDATDVGTDVVDALVDGAAGDVTDDHADVGGATDASCATGQTVCGGACVELARDTRNCGRCGAACAVTGAEATCAAGVCGYATCSPGYSDCDGVATNGCEIDVRSAADNCGSCGNACRYANATPRCAGGSCAIAACATGYGNCDGVATNGCETDVRTTNAHCGACGHACLSGQSCAAGACVEVQRSCATAGTPGCGLVMVPGGTFTLGSDVAGDAAQAGTRVSAFTIDRYEVTVARFRSFWEAGHPAPAPTVRYPNGSDLIVSGAISTETDLRSDADCNWRYSTRDSHPINCVNWYTAMAFCLWDGARLPTQAEWEQAAAGMDGRHVPWRSTASPAPVVTNDEVTSHACVQWTSTFEVRTSTCAVDLFPSDASPHAVSGVHGNVFEWVADWFAPYRRDGLGCWPGPGRSDPLCLVRTAGQGRTFRGAASWVFGFKSLVFPTLEDAQEESPDAADPRMGFRCARSR